MPHLRFLAFLVLLFPQFAQANDGKTLFTTNCSVCHLPDRQIVGPSLVEISKLYPNKETLPEFLKWCETPQ